MNNKDRILVYIHGWFIHFGISKFLKENFDCDIFGIIDFDDKARKFFEQQNLVEFNKKWFYKDSLSNEVQSANISYLNEIEKKYDLNLWKIVYTDKSFYKFNYFYNFKDNEILSILEKECRFFENILLESKPDFYLSYLPQTHHERLIYQMVKGLGIPVLMLSPTRIAGKFMIADDDSLKMKDMKMKIESLQDKSRSLSELREQMKKFDATSYIAKIRKEHFESNKWARYKSIMKFFFSSSSNYSSRYSYYGRTKSKVFLNKISTNIKRRKRKSFIDKNFLHSIDTSSPFAYFPIHYEPEYVLLTTAPYYDNQLSVISNIAKSLPVEYKLFVKEHPQQGTIGWKSVDFYKDVIKLPNVYLLHPDIPSNEVIEKSSLVFSIAGTSGLEAALYNKPAILFSDQIYSDLNSIFKVNNLEELPTIIKKALDYKPDVSLLEKLLTVIQDNSLDLDLDGIGIDFSYRFGFKGPMMDSELPESEVKLFLDDHEDVLKKLALDHVKKIKELKLNKFSIKKSN